MKLNLYNILKNVLNESVEQNVVTDAINNKNVVRLKYIDNQAHATGVRTIEPYMLFIHKSSGNTLLLVYQWEGDTYRGKPAWKTLDINKIESGSWKTLSNKHFVSEPKDRFANAPEYKNAHKYASSIIDMVTFDNRNKKDVIFIQKELKEHQFVDFGKKYSEYRKNVSNTERNDDEKARYWGDYDKAEQERQNQQRLLNKDDEMSNYHGPIKRNTDDENN